MIGLTDRRYAELKRQLLQDFKEHRRIRPLKVLRDEIGNTSLAEVAAALTRMRGAGEFGPERQA
ncbi:MAG: hypothetical protein ACR2PG_08235 [Hyphomicrobiaceae bacterium]